MVKEIEMFSEYLFHDMNWIHFEYDEKRFKELFCLFHFNIMPTLTAG